MFGFFKKHEECITDKYIRLMDEGKFTEALVVIEEIVSLNPNIGKSHFNYGICLSQLGRHEDSSTAFLRAYELDETDGGALYRACISLALANSKKKLYDVFKSELVRDPFIINNFIGEQTFNNFFLESEFKNLKEQYSDYIGKDE
jgi:tetratricopeptide (TPR) repeat protein